MHNDGTTKGKTVHTNRHDLPLSLKQADYLRSLVNRVDREDFPAIVAGSRFANMEHSNARNQHPGNCTGSLSRREASELIDILKTALAARKTTR